MYEVMLQKIGLLIIGLLAAQVSAVEINLWRTLTAEDEMATFNQQVARFNQQHPESNIVVEAIPHGAYSEAVIGGALAQRLPCIIAVDQPNIANYAWSGLIRPLFIADGHEKNLLKYSALSHVNTNGLSIYNDKIYAAGSFDISLALFSRRSLLKRLNIRVPTIDSPWSVEEFNQILFAIKKDQSYKYIFDLNLSGVGEWHAYAFLPMIYSAGGDFIERQDYQSAEGYMNHPGVVRWAKWLQWLLEQELTQLKNLEHGQFEKNSLAIQYTGSWMIERYRKAVGDDLLILPPIDFGEGVFIGGGVGIMLSVEVVQTPS
ncbi:ABC transporter substrate-binding protein [Catenovulum sediminis]|uniref:ABC transporter substrate-binding protein n=1 Tax=Catenovulum sediminis TaxID=1740262 RepID=UPI00117BFF1A|nr:extracellular solute-binding protein [Catenovulum sediminis]